MQAGKFLNLPVMGMLALLASSATCVAEDPSPEARSKWPTTAWSVSSPEAQGMSSADLADGLQFALANNLNVHSVTVVRHGVIVLDAYFYPFLPETRHDVASVTKSIVSLLTGIATAQGYLRGPDQPLVTALPPQQAANVADAAAKVRLSDLLSMRSGFDCGFKSGETELREMRSTQDWVAHAVRLPMIAEPGTRFGYCSPNFHLLSAAISSSTQASALEFGRRHLFEPLGITDVYWPADAKGITHGWGDLQLRPRDMAKIGLMMLRGGRWQEQQVVSASWIDSSVKNHFRATDSNDYGLGWWMPHRIPGLFEATGRGGQRISITPEKDIVVVFTGGGFEPYEIGQFILKAVRSDEPLTADPAGEKKLAETLRRVAAPPARRVPVKPTIRGDLSGRVYNLEKNPLGVRSLAVEFANPDASSLNLELDNGEKIAQPLGMNGQYRLTRVNGGAVTAGRAEWFEDGRLRIEFNRLSLINRFVMDLAFLDDHLELVVSEPTEFGAVKMRGIAGGRPRSPAGE
jgi:CubicO group peptidase (beta-lactamase class C family)